ncbi:ATP-dependent zinc metalloprotease FTSH 12, chloroplastic-like isoform X2 [Malus sylvestris]|uniref:ATP-dependent zinc metalloprotease FTSH 12, chloroplastic-like isoform X2 n=1 Tax=Malus sylvestris TaxID=3752 RepID=UPI0021AC68C5|nr:ATP-dependent zinc metalloprotease FTSH 12, chloroplastic-like isoform X2 [Malus sylvestris]
MDLQITYKSNPLLLSFTPISHTSPRPLLFNLPTKHRPKISRQRPVFRVMASASSNGSDGFSWLSLSRSIRRGSERFWFDFGEWVKETGFDLKEVNVIVGEYLELVGDRLKKGGIELERFRTELLPEFVSWNQWERWKIIDSNSEEMLAFLSALFKQHTQWRSYGMNRMMNICNNSSTSPISSKKRVDRGLYGGSDS